jgi:hypothetical protein
LDNVDQITAGGSGTYESAGKHRWKTNGLHPQSDGRELISEGEIDLAARSWKGTLFENS